jgi:rSAM/selenodomain-associated transferase 1
MSSRSGRRPETRLIVMARHPEPGRVKTRLAAVLGDDRACALHRAFVLDLADRLASLPYEVTWAHTPTEAPFPALLPHARCVPQVGGDLGARMAHAVAAAFAEDTRPVLVIGADVPHVPATSLAEAAEMAATRVVLGPAEDGGYYLIGLARPIPELFRDVPWGSDAVLETTRGRARGLGLATHMLPPMFDIDEPPDLDRLRGLLHEGVVLLPRTAALLAPT